MLAMQQKLLELGFLPNEQVSVTHRSPFGDPIAVRINDGLYSLRKIDAEQVWVKPMPDK